MLDITIADLMELEPRLSCATRPLEFQSGEVNPLDRAISWAVSVRSTPPHLPNLRGGEILLLSSRAVAAVEDELPALAREVAARGVVAVVVESGEVFA